MNDECSLGENKRLISKNVKKNKKSNYSKLLTSRVEHTNIRWNYTFLLNKIISSFWNFYFYFFVAMKFDSVVWNIQNIWGYDFRQQCIFRLFYERLMLSQILSKIRYPKRYLRLQSETAFALWTWLWWPEKIFREATYHVLSVMSHILIILAYIP